jgi:hypothetical protein
MARFPAPLRMPALALALVGAAAGAAAAFDLGGATIQMRLELPKDDGDGFIAPASAKKALEFMNRAHCVCSDTVFNVEFKLANPPASLETQEVDIYVGTRCADPDPSIRDQNCVQVADIADVESIRFEENREIRVRDLIATNADECPSSRGKRIVYALIDENDDGIGDGDHSFTLDIDTDAEPPPLPSGVVARGAEQAIEVSWTLPTARADDIEYFQVLCSPLDELDDGVSDASARYLTAEMACDVDDGTRAESAPGVVFDDALTRLDPAFVCGETAGTSKSIRIGGLDNGVDYRVVLVAVDPARNPRGLDLGVARPQPARDFWEDYKDRGGTAEGGCATGGGAGLAGGLLVVGLVGLVGLVRRRQRLAVGAVLGLALAGSGTAGAQPYFESYDEPVVDDLGPPAVSWNLDLKLGPYLPAIDAQLDLPEGQEGPFAEMFGDGRFWLSQLTLERFLLRRFGQLGVTGSIGYLATNARAYRVDEDGNVERNPSGTPVRAESDKTGFRLVPTSLGVVYRYTELDDMWGVPLVPYGRLGLSYYMWWVTAPSGGVAEAPTADCPAPDAPDAGCTGDRARGGSLGWQATVGLALRAERFDRDAEAALRNELGIAHAGLFAELTYAKVDGFGADTKLAVGDVHWSFGLTFEF